jgi:hypothetical protein
MNDKRTGLLPLGDILKHSLESKQSPLAKMREQLEAATRRSRVLVTGIDIECS